MKNYADLLFIDGVRALQDEDGTGEKFASVYHRRTESGLTEEEREFIEQRRSFYLASVSSTGWPYVQHRGGPAGFLKVIGPSRLGFADYRGNRQFITMGHSAKDDRVAMILMDYENRERLKLLGRLKMTRAVEVDPALVEQLATPGEGKVERIAVIEVEATDWNCPQYIPRLVEIERLEALQKENAILRERLGEAV